MYLSVGVVFFRQLSSGLSIGVGLIRSRKNFIKAFPFPRACVVMSRTMTNVINSLPQMFVVVLVCGLYPGGPGFSLEMFALLLLLPLLYLFQLGCCFIAASVTHLLPDTGKVINVFIRLWFYGSGIFFGVERFSQFPQIEKLLVLNPAIYFLTAFRDILSYRTLPSLDIFLYLCCFSLGMLVIGFTVFWRNEPRYARF